MASNQYLARLGFVLALDQSEFVEKLTETQRKWKDFSNEAKRDSAQAAKAILELDEATKTYGKTLTKVEQVQRDIDTGKYAKAEQWQKELLLQKAAAYDKVAQAAQKANQAQMKSGGLTPQQSAALGYQTTDIITGLAGGQNPLMVLLQQGGQLRDQFGGFKNLFAAIGQVLTPMRAAILGVGGAIGTLGFAFYQGSEEVRKFHNAMILTGQFAGITQQQFLSMGKAISDGFNIPVSQSREVMQQLVASGQYTYKSLDSVAQVIAKISSLSGESASDTAQKLIPALDGSASSAKKLNDQYHFLNLEQYKYIELLNAQGKIQEAIKFTSDALNKKLQQQEENLGYVEAAWKNAKKAASDFWDFIKSIGREDKDATAAAMASAVKTMEYIASQHKGAKFWESPQYKKAMEEYVRLSGEMEKKAAEARATADEEVRKKTGIDAYANAGGRSSELSWVRKNAELKAEIEYEAEAAGLGKVQQLRLNATKEIKKATAEYLSDMETQGRAFGNLIRDNYFLKVQKAQEAMNRGIQDFYEEEEKKYRDKAKAEEDSVWKEREKLQVYKDNILSSEYDLKIALSRLDTEAKIAEVKKADLSDDRKAMLEDRYRAMQAENEQIIRQGEELDKLKNINSAVFRNMESAIDNFVRTGKLSFKDLAQSIIQDLIAIQLKAQATSLMRSIGFGGSGFLFGGSGTVDIAGEGTMSIGQYFGGARAAGGPVDGNTPYLVGEQGPEMFVPRSAGTIVPNNQLASTMSAPQVVYNGPYIANMQAIDTQSATQFLARNKQAVYAANQSAARGLPTSR